MAPSRTASPHTAATVVPAPSRRGAASRELALTVALLPEPDGGFSAVCLTIPGVFGQGDTEAEALDDVRRNAIDFVAIAKSEGDPLPKPGLARDLVATEYLERVQERRVIVRL